MYYISAREKGKDGKLHIKYFNREADEIDPAEVMECDCWDERERAERCISIVNARRERKIKAFGKCDDMAIYSPVEVHFAY